MTDIKISIIIRKTPNVEFVNPVFNQTFENYEYFISDDNVSSINDSIKRTTGDYVIFINSDDVLIPNALANIAKMIYLTGSDIIKCNKLSNYDQELPDVTVPDFKYVFKHDEIMQYAFCDLSGFCIKKELIQYLDFNSSSHIQVFDILMHAKDMAATDHVYISTKQLKPFVSNISEYMQITDYFFKHKNDNSEHIWKNYFANLIPRIVKDTTKQNDKDVFAYCCKRIPLKLIPLKYRFIFFIMKTCI